MYIISVATTPIRINKLIKNIPILYKNLTNNCFLFLINICNKYKRFNETIELNELSKNIILQYKDKFKLHYCRDYGPITKYIGGVNFIKKHNLKYDLLIADDDIGYTKHYWQFYEKAKNMFDDISYAVPYDIMAGSGFNLPITYPYEMVPKYPDVLEGFSGIYFKNKLINNNVYFFVKIFDILNSIANQKDNISQVIKTLFLADDYLISLFFKNKMAFCNMEGLVPQGFGYEEDALQYNNLQGSNINSYNFLDENKKIISTLMYKSILHQQLIKSNL
jgi:hypothetical protein